jgi:hypothetical protein
MGEEIHYTFSGGGPYPIGQANMGLVAGEMMEYMAVTEIPLGNWSNQ